MLSRLVCKIRCPTCTQVVVTHYEDVPATRVVASISRDGVAVATNQMVVQATSAEESATRPLLLKIPWQSGGVNRTGTGASTYKLHVEGRLMANGGIVYEHDTELEVRKQFLTITITTNHAVYDAEQTVVVRAVILTPAGN